jgi:hypothetical protein
MGTLAPCDEEEGEDSDHKAHPYEVEDDDNGEEVDTSNQDHSHPVAWDNEDGGEVNRMHFLCVEVESSPNSSILTLNSLVVVHPQQLSYYHLEASPAYHLAALNNRAHRNDTVA